MDQSRLSAIPMKSLEPESDEEEQEIDDTLDSLKEHLKNCQKLGKYVEAQMAMNRIAELKEKKVNMKLAKLKTSQEKELKLYQGTHEKELAGVEAKWQKKLEELDAKSKAEEDSLLDKHSKELFDARREAEGKITEKAHPSQEIVALKKMEEALAKQGNFEGAHKIKMEVLQKEQQEQVQWEAEREGKIQSKLQVIAMRQGNELEVLRATHEKARTALEKTMASETDQ